MVLNITSIKTSSNGVWEGDNPLDYAFPLLTVQIILVVALSRSLAFLLKPLRQPKVIAEILGGVLLGPSALGRNKKYLHRIFPSWSTPTLESVATIGLLFFLFLVGLELDLRAIRRSGSRAFTIAAVGISLPFVCGIGVALLLRKTLPGADQAAFAQFLVFMGVALSITAFPVLARILAELKLLTTRVGETAMAAAAFNDVAAWILLALAVALAGGSGSGSGSNSSSKSPLVSLWVLLSGVGFVVFMMVVVRPLMKVVARRGENENENEAVGEVYVCLTLAGVLVSGFVTDFIGIHAIFGAFVFGLTVPKEGNMAKRLVERIEDFVLGLLLPLYFASSGLKTDVTSIRGASAWGLLVVVIFTACAGKILGTFVVAMFCMIPVRESLTLGVLMNTKGLVELIVLNIGKEKKVLNDEIFAILVLMALFTTFMTTPIVMAVYKPAGGTPVKSQRKLGANKMGNEFRVLACIHGPNNIPSIISLIESTRGTSKSLIKLFLMHLVELSERSSSIMMVQRARKNGFPFFNRRNRHLDLAGAFPKGQVKVRSTTAISSLSTMHEDICHVAEEKRVTIIILPFHKHWRLEADEDCENDNRRRVLENVGHEWRVVNQKVLKKAPCSVAVLVDRGNLTQTASPIAALAQRVCIIFFGGPDDREALELGEMMLQHPTVEVRVVRFVQKDGLNGNESNDIVLSFSNDNNSDKSYSFSTANMNRQTEQELDEAAIAKFRSKLNEKVEYIEKVSENIVEQVVAIGKSGDYDVIVVGKGRFLSNMVAGLAKRQAEHAELGPIGDVLTSSEHDEVTSSILIIQQHDVTIVDDAPIHEVHNEDDKVNDNDSSHRVAISITNNKIV
ncbi:cation/H(+) antiporter 20 [Cajanus cajan]|uniref:K(+)/H(+) antiporter 1 n=1 Tax=Cajanus cajan TaxID=3821 RepID=A0A151TUU9_CAJCA|nr:cation/H(+) antiporter 20 [Cajanus cajan]KYP70781.1 K(+)/H(+) antiporter 1 [Cajanus cajan]